MDEKFVLENEDLSTFDSGEIVSVNGRDNMDEIKARYPKLEIIIGKATPEDKPVRLNLLQMEYERAQIFDAATDSILGKRIDRLEKDQPFPFSAVTFILGAMLSASVWLYFGKVFY